VNFATGQNHVNLPQPDDNQCKNCHVSKETLAFDASIPGAHDVPNNSPMLPGIVLKILKIQNATPGNSPTVSFQVTDKSGNPVDITKLTTIRMILAGNNTDYGVAPPGMARISETPTKATPGTNGTYTYTMTAVIPAASVGSFTISMDGERGYAHGWNHGSDNCYRQCRTGRTVFLGRQHPGRCTAAGCVQCQSALRVIRTWRSCMAAAVRLPRRA
jgi:hypothetical protein